jgi:colanic acid/amylovoran biosynthesis protein
VVCMNILLLGLNPFSGNRGVGALAYSTLYLLEKIRKRRNMNFKYFIVMPNAKISEVIIDDEKIDLRSIVIPYAGSGLAVLKALRKPSNIKSLVSIDYVFAMGEGDSFSDIYGDKRFNNILNPINTTILFGKKVMFLPQTIGPFNSLQNRRRAEKCLSRAKYVMVRDNMSYQYISEMKMQINYKESVDLAFFMPYNRRRFDPSRIHVGINVSSLLWFGGYTGNNQFNLVCDYQRLIKSIIDYFTGFEKVQLHLVPHVVLPDRNIENDYFLGRELLNQIPADKAVLAPFFIDPVDAKSYISGLDFFVGARMHACIAAFSSGVPVIPMAYSRKFNGLFINTLGYPAVADMLADENETLLSKIISCYKDKSSLKIQIENINKITVSKLYEEVVEGIDKFII